MDARTAPRPASPAPPPGDGQPHALPPLLRIRRRPRHDDEACDGVCETARKACGRPDHSDAMGRCAEHL